MSNLTPFYKSPLFFFHMVTHLSCIPMILFGGWREWGIALLFYFLYGCLGVAMTFHRMVSHGSFKAPRPILHFGLILGTLGGVGSVLQWSAVHRNHHRFSDTDKDPHNPKGQFFKMQFLTMLVPSSPKYVADLMRQKVYQFYHRYYWAMHLIWVALLIVIDPFSLVYAYFFPSLILWHAMSSLGTFTHLGRFGYKNFEGKDDSYNIPLLSWLIFGEGWHNNHHHEPHNWRFGLKSWEVDLTGWIINIIKIKK